MTLTAAGGFTRNDDAMSDDSKRSWGKTILFAVLILGAIVMIAGLLTFSLLMIRSG